jgi:hypothetical protein
LFYHALQLIHVCWCDLVGVCLLQDAVQLVDLASAAAERYAACMSDVEELASCSYPAEAVPQQLRAMEEQMRQRLEVRRDMLVCAA